MLLVKFLLDEGKASRHRLALDAFLASLGSVLLLVTVNLAAAKITKQGQDTVDWSLAVLFVVAALMYYLAENDLIRQIGAAMERAIDNVRMRLFDAICAADYVAIERMGSATLYESITQATGALSQNSQFIALSIRSAVLTAMVLLYILYLSPIAFVLVLAATVAVGMMYSHLGGRLAQRYASMMGVERNLFQAVGDLFDGFKEVRLSSARSADLAQTFTAVSGHSTAIRIDVQSKAFQQLIFGHVAFFFLLAVVVFVVPTYAAGFASDVVKISAAVIFMIGPLGGVIQAVTVMASAEAAAQRVLELDRQLAGLAEPGHELGQEPINSAFDELRLSNVLYTYPVAADEQPFSVGPLDLRIRRGEVVFVTGGNGSGKSTFLKLLVGLYRPDHGHLAIDGQPVGDRTRRAYRELFAAVFTDSYLFRRLYGMPQVNPKEARTLLAWLEMDRVTALAGDSFTRTDLSSGQRKRVMLVAALLAHRPVLILDEWAADQDPRFRRTFYREIVPELKARGITIIAVTHDDHYFDAADRRLHFEEGRMIEIMPEEGR
jgi:putative ATP-binding cassette transporter